MTENYRRCLYFNDCGRKGITRYKDEGWICLKHYNRLIGNPKQTIEYRRKYNKISWSKTLWFCNKPVYVGFVVRKGICERCGRKNGDKFIKTRGGIGTILTHKHHYFYLRIMVWACTEEICNLCHGIESNK